MPFKIWAVGEEVLAADLQAYVQDQVTAVFPSAAARDAAIPAPKVGQVCYLTDTHTLFVYAGTAWRRPWNLPWGLCAVVESVANVGPIVGPGNIPGLNFNYQHTSAGRRLRLTSDLMLQGNTAANEARSFILRDAVQLNYRAVYLAQAGRSYSVITSATFTSDAASHAYITQMGVSVGAGNVLSNAANGVPASLLLEDIGPAPGTLPTLLPGPDEAPAEPKEVTP